MWENGQKKRDKFLVYAYTSSAVVNGYEGGEIQPENSHLKSFFVCFTGVAAARLIHINSNVIFQGRSNLSTLVCLFLRSGRCVLQLSS